MAVSDPIATFTRENPRTGDKQERAAYTPAEAVQLRADGWIEKKTTKSSGGSSGSSSSSGASKPN